MERNTLKLSGIEFYYDIRDGSVGIKSKDRKLKGKPFLVKFKSDTPGYHDLLNILDSQTSKKDRGMILPYGLKFTETSQLFVAGSDPRLKFKVGESSDWKPAIIDLNHSPHTLISGGTNSGKSNLLRLVIAHGVSQPKSELWGSTSKGIGK